MPISNKGPQKIVHVLEEGNQYKSPKMDLIKTSEIIANMPVVFDEINLEAITDEDFIITDVTPVIKESVPEEPAQLQADLVFDLPLNSYTEVKAAEEIRFNLKDEKNVNVNEIQDFEADEIKVETEKRYVLEDFDAKPTIGKSSHIAQNKEVVKEEEMNFELKRVTPKAEINEVETISEDISPLELTINELQKRAEERRKKMKGFNYKFNDQLNKNIDEIERQPAYKRQGVDLNLNAAISKSKTAIKKDDDQIDFKSNNSFLHDNVD
jgi:cell division protein FtsZ